MASKKKASKKSSVKFRDLKSKRDPKGGGYVKITPGRNYLNPQPLPP